MQIRSMLNWAMRRNQVKYFIRRAANEGSGVSDEIRLSRFNAVWKDAYENVPFYEEWKVKHSLPDAIASLKDLSSWPVLEKRDIILNANKFIRAGYKGPYHESVTGGSTGEPLHFRVWPQASDEVTSSLWMGWARWGVYPDSRIFLLWGHRHFYGNGWRRKIKIAIKYVRDTVTNKCRADATDLSVSSLEKIVKRMLAFRPEAVIAYSASLLALCRSLPQYSERCRALKLKAVICTAGPLTAKERAFMSEYFGCPVAMEYGSMEGGMIAYMSPALNGRYGVFESTHFIHTLPEVGSDNQQVLVTKIYPCYLPLIRYRIGDYIKGVSLDAHGMVTSFDEVYGRIGDEVDMGNGIRFHGQTFMVCAEGFDQIIAYQIRVDKAKGHVTFVAQSISPLTADEKCEIKRRAAHMSGLQIKDISIEESSNLAKAPSGKIRLVVFENE